MTEQNPLHNELQDVAFDDIFDEEMQDMNQVDSGFNNIKIQPSVDKDHDPVFLLRTFYRSLFPYNTFFEWLNYSKDPTLEFTHREFSFTLAGDIYIRFKSFNDANEFQTELNRLQPIKMDIGAVYSIRPRDKKTVSEQAFKPLRKELVFDIDMTDYDDIRTCCSGGDICTKCWEFMTVAIKVIDSSLRSDFGYKHILWVYSGRRGVHCWVCDEHARNLDNEGRKAIVGFLEVVKGGSQVARKVKLTQSLHPSLERSHGIIQNHFEQLLLVEMGILDDKEQWDKVLAILPDSDTREILNEKWEGSPTRASGDKWDDLVKEVDKTEHKKKFKDDVARDIQFQYCYPRLDDKVSTNINHLLKSPFCVHPKTLKVCVPIRADKCEEFNPLKVPDLNTINRELNEYQKTDKNIAEYKKTSLKPYIEYFEKFVTSMINDLNKNKGSSMEF